MKPRDFVDTWRGNTRTERAASQTHFRQLCQLLGVPEPYSGAVPDDDYGFEKGAAKTGGGDGWADVWKRGCFAWEYKGPHANLDAALKQLKLYQGALHNPPLLIVSDMERIEVHTSWTNMVQERHVFTLDDLLDAAKREKLAAAFSETGVEAFRPNQKRADLTKEVAEKFVELAQRLRARGHAPEAVAHFVNRMVFCMFAEDVKLLPEKLFTKLLQVSAADPDQFKPFAERLFSQMRTGGSFDLSRIEWFNGGLFDDDAALPLERADIRLALEAAEKHWENIDPSIMGTLFERGLDPDKRSQLGAHYTDPEKIMMIVSPVIVEPLTREWEAARAQIAEEMDKSRSAKSAGAKTQAFNRAREHQARFLEALKGFRVLDPACGSGNFLYLALKALKDIEHRANTECEELGLPRVFPAVGPENMLGIEINPFAAELARVSVWIGEIQWMREHGFDVERQPILKSMENIVCHDALLNEDGTEYHWPKADVIIGNPPFLGGKLLLSLLGTQYVERLRSAYAGKVPNFADLVCFWFEKAGRQLVAGETARVGLVATNSIRGGASRLVLDAIASASTIYEAWSDEPWAVEGAAVRVSIVCFGHGEHGFRLNGAPVERINTDLTSLNVDLTTASVLQENSAVCFEGGQKHGEFDLPGTEARVLLLAKGNPNGRPNSDVLRPCVNAMDIVRRGGDTWLIDFGDTMSEADASLYEAPFERIKRLVKPYRDASSLSSHRDSWWRHHRTRPGLRKRVGTLSRYLCTPVVAKHRVFVWVDRSRWPTNLVDAIARDDDTTFGVLHSRMHELWSLRLGTSLEDRPRYTPSTTFETFPFPEGLTPNIPAADYAGDPRAQAIAAAAKRLNELREAWLNPPDLVVREPEVVPGYPDRILPKDEGAAAELKKRTLTNLYNQRPAWLAHAHRDLDAAVAVAYGWMDYDRDAGLPDEVILERLFVLNQERSAADR
jgi:type II restriction/modification system DNA methylase subunit YeeA